MKQQIKWLGPVLVVVCACAGAVAATTGADVTVSTEWKVDLKTVGIVAGVVMPATWWLSKVFQQVLDRLKGLEQQLNNLPCRRECGVKKD